MGWIVPSEFIMTNEGAEIGIVMVLMIVMILILRYLKAIEKGREP